jgi:DNA topoisomerase-1
VAEAGKKVVILESPTKAKAIAGYLGKGWVVRASNGHVRDLPEDDFGVDVEHDFEPTYTLLGGRQKVISGLKKLAQGAAEVYLATDPDREGEAIAWHLREALGLDAEAAQRVTYHEVTKNAVLKAFEDPGAIDMNLVNAQQARRILDRIVGYELSPLISKRIARGLSAGRVQSVAVRLIVEREREIEAFDSEEFWRLTAVLEKKEGEGRLEALLKTIEGEEPKVGTEEAARALVERLSGEDYRVAEIRRKKTGSKAAPPFITSTLQQAASTQLRWNAQRTMRVAQQLYEGLEIGGETAGLITYMRTDSTRVATSAIAACRGVIEQEYGAKYLPKQPNRFRMPKGAQAAHEAIRPTDPARLPKAVARYLSDDQKALYTLIWNRFTASQMKPALYNVTEVDVTAGPALFLARGREMVFDGWLRVAGTSELTESESKQKTGEDGGRDALLPDLTEGEMLRLIELVPSQHFTQPPPRYSEATLIRTLERLGIGRPSTYAAIVSTIQRRNYVRRDGRVFRPTPLGREVTDQLVEHFPTELDVEFTSKMEEKLDRVESGKADWVEVLRAFYNRFEEDLARAKEEMKRSEEIREGEPAVCEECGKPMKPRFSRDGRRFLGCSGYPECKFTWNPPREDEEVTEHKCPKCGEPMFLRTARRGRRRYLACSGYPNCKNIMGIDKEGKPVEIAQPEETGEACPECGKPLLVRSGRKGRFVGCSGYPRCRFTKPLEDEEGAEGKPEGEPKEGEAKEGGEAGPKIEPCEKCGKAMVVRSSRRGKFLGCSGFPSCRNTRPLPAEMKQKREKKPPPEPAGFECEKCGKPMVVRQGPRGKFAGCSGYPKCRNTKKLEG